MSVRHVGSKLRRCPTRPPLVRPDKILALEGLLDARSSESKVPEGGIVLLILRAFAPLR